MWLKIHSKSRLPLQIDTLLDRTACLLRLGAGLAMLRVRIEYLKKLQVVPDRLLSLLL